MINLFRIDERLIHGQIATKWTRHAGVDRIIVADDDAAENPVIIKSLKMAVPAGIKAAIKNVDQAIELLKDPRCKEMKLLVIVGNPKAALRIVEEVEGIPFVDVGNYGRAASAADGKKREAYGSSLYCDEEDIEDFRKIMDKGINCIYQMMPEDPAEDLKKIFK